ncbi:MAG: 40S ribosomal protein S3 [Marteilia pararefringens]
MAHHQQQFKTYTRKIIENGLLQAEIDHMIGQILPDSGFISAHFLCKNGYQIKITTRKAQTQNIFTTENRNLIRLAVAQRLQVPLESISIIINQLADNCTSSIAMADRVKELLEQGMPARRAAQSVLRIIMSAPSKPMGAQIMISGKLRGQRAKPAKFSSGVMLHTGNFVREVVNTAVRHVKLHVGVIGVKVKICMAPTKEMKVPDYIEISKGKEVVEESVTPSFIIDSANFPAQLTKYLNETVEAQE